jgi:FMN phosphatase YigB (HAD superfamily)
VFNREAFVSVKVNLADFSVLISDIDYTLVDFGKGHWAAIEALANIFGRQLADEVSRIFHLVLEGHRRAEGTAWGGAQAFQEVMDRIKQLQAPWLETYGIKPWSREAWIIIVAQRLQLPLTPQQVEEGRDAYWHALSDSAMLYDDTRVFLASLQETGIPLVLMTSSDSICRVEEDHTVKYDPVYSEQYKRKRLKRLPLEYQALVIGDPIDKPDPRFFDRVFQAVAGLGNFPMNKILVVGDSERSDLQEPRQRGCKTLLVKRDD